MGDYYNKTRGPVAVTLLRGGSMSVGPKTWCFIDPADEGTASLAEAVRKNFLSRALVPITVPARVETPAPVVVAPVVVAPTVEAAPAPVVATSSSASPDPVSADGSAAEPESTHVSPKQYRKNKSSF